MSGVASRELFERAKRVLAGGVNSPVRAFSPYPFYTERAEGSKMWDVDGNRYIDYCMGYGPLLFGHAPTFLRQAIADQLEAGWLYGTPTEGEVELAERLCKYYPSIDVVRLVSTGTEATMGALRIARGYTQKSKIIKIEGGFHGAHDAVLVKAGSGALTHGVPDSQGVPNEFTRNTLQVPFNDAEALSDVLDANRDEVAALIIEPVMGNVGPVLPEDGYLEEVRGLTREHDVVLIFDEVITGFRLALGGAQQHYGVVADMTTLGKVLGGGLPIGVIGGRREIMETVAPQGKVYQAGTFNANPLSVRAGLAITSRLEDGEVHRRLSDAGRMLREHLEDVVHTLGLPYSVVGIGSMFKLFFGDEPKSYTQAKACDAAGYLTLFRCMLEEGVFLPPSQFETNFISYAHTDEDIEKTVLAYERCLKKIGR